MSGPDGTHVALAGPIGVGITRANGLEQCFLKALNGFSSFSDDWSPDGRWLLSDDANGSMLIEASTLRRFALPVTVERAAWRPF